jgi:uncharacterized protein DUF3141
VAQGLAHEDAARVARSFHPLRVQRWMFSDLNPWMAALGPAAAAVRANRREQPASAGPRRVERYMSEMLSASLDYYRALRDATSETAFFQLYGNMLAIDTAAASAAPLEQVRDQAFARRVLEDIGRGGYLEAVARVGALLARHGEPIPLARLDLKRELVKKYDELLPRVEAAEWRRVRGEQEVIASLEPERALAALGALIPKAADRTRLMTLLDHMIDEGETHGVAPTPEQHAVLARVREILGAPAPTRLRAPAAGKRRKKATT